MDDTHVGAEFGLPPSTHNLADPLQRLREDLAEAHADLIARRDELLAGVERAPTTVTDEDMNKRLTDFGGQLAKAAKLAEARHEIAKRPHLEAGRVVDAFFVAGIAARLRAASKTIADRLTVFQKAKEAAARKAAEEAERARREEERKAREASEAAFRAAQAAERDAKSQAERDAAMQRAIDAEADANRAAEQARLSAAIAASKPADLSRTHGDLGTTSSLRPSWKYEVVDPAAEPREYLVLDDQKIRAAIKSGVRQIVGLRIFEHAETRFRS